MSKKRFGYGQSSRQGGEFFTFVFLLTAYFLAIGCRPVGQSIRMLIARVSGPSWNSWHPSIHRFHPHGKDRYLDPTETDSSTQSGSNTEPSASRYSRQQKAWSSKPGTIISRSLLNPLRMRLTSIRGCSACHENILDWSDHTHLDSSCGKNGSLSLKSYIQLGRIGIDILRKGRDHAR